MTNVNTQMRKGFTMIELVFVIVIIGILAAVALPKFTGISDDAHVSKLQAFTGTLNRTVGPSIWSGLQRAEPAVNGSVVNATAAKYKNIGTPDSALGNDGQIDSMPSEFIGTQVGQLADETAVLDLTKCNATSTTTIPAVGKDGSAVAGIIATSGKIGTTTYSLGCVDSDLSGAPRFYLIDNTTKNIVAK